MIQTKTILTLLFVSATLLLTACTTTPEMHTQTIPNSEYRQALAATDPAQFVLPAPDSEAEQAMLGPVKALFELFEVYAEDVYFRDAFKEFKKATDIRDYMLEGLKPLEKAEFVFNRVARSGGDYYLDWTMRLDFKKTPPGTWEESIGVSHMRFNSEGKVIFHQDYWDPTDIVYRRIPIAKQLIAFVKGQM